MSEYFETSRRYRALWDRATETEQGLVIPTVEEEYVEGSLRPQITSLSAEAAGKIIHLTNGEAAFLGDDDAVKAKLAQLEELAA
jgi:hypothetical protein